MSDYLTSLIGLFHISILKTCESKLPEYLKKKTHGIDILTIIFLKNSKIIVLFSS